MMKLYDICEIPNMKQLSNMRFSESANSTISTDTVSDRKWSKPMWLNRKHRYRSDKRSKWRLYD